MASWVLKKMYEFSLIDEAVEKLGAGIVKLHFLHLHPSNEVSESLGILPPFLDGLDTFQVRAEALNNQWKGGHNEACCFSHGKESSDL